LELLRELDPTTSHVTVITNPANANTAQFVTAITTAGNSMKVAIQNALVRNVAEIENAIETCSKQPGGSLIILPDSLAIVHRKLIIELAARYRLPAVYPFRIFAEDGGLLSYETNFKAVYSRAAEYVDKILRGTSAANLPVEAPNKLELVVNMKTAKALGLTMPRSLQIAADKLIE
ncbi:MAG: ABC transporter substrate-binding protein, partial [Pseudolabrys sp.]